MDIPQSCLLNRRDLSSARMQLRGIVKQTQERFCDTEDFQAVTAALECTEAALQHLKDADA